MDERREWLLVDGAEWTVFATLAEQDATPIVQARTVRGGLSQDNRRRSSRVRTRRVHPDVLRRQMEEKRKVQG